MPKNQDSKTLFTAAEKGNIEDIKRLIENGADVHARTKDKNQATALQVAAKEGYAECVKVLLEKGADVDSKNGNGKIPLQVAETDEIKQLLINAMK